MSDTKSSIKGNHLSVFIFCAFAGLAQRSNHSWTNRRKSVQIWL